MLRNLSLIVVMFSLCLLGCPHGHGGNDTIDPPVTGVMAPVEPLQGNVVHVDRSGGDEEMLTDASLTPVFFDFDSSQIRSDQAPVLDQDANYIRSKAGMVFVIEGHCDERGTEEYNLALGAHRAEVTRMYLIQHGIEETRLSTISYGEFRPFDQGHSEESWQKNRRAHFVVRQ